MTPVFVGSYLLLWLLVAVLTVLVLLLYRQYGLSALPAKARMRLAGLDLGSSAPRVEVAGPGGRLEPLPMTARTSADPSEPVLQVVLFASNECPICSRLWGEVGTLADLRPEVDFWWVDTEPPDAATAPRGWVSVSGEGRAAHEAMEVPALPYAYALDGDGAVRAKGLMNDLDDFHQLIDVAAGDLPDAARARLTLHLTRNP